MIEVLLSVLGGTFVFLVYMMLRNEWVYRLYCEPRRLWKRYLLGNSIFLSLLLRQMVETKIESLFRSRKA